MLRRISRLVVVCLLLHAPAAPAAPTTEDAKTKAEIAKLEAERRKIDNDDKLLNRLIPLASVLVGAVGLWIGVRKAGIDRIDALKAAEEERRKSDETRFDTRFESVVTRLSSDSPAEQRAGAVMLDALVQDKDRTNAEQAIALLLALLKKGHKRDAEAGRTLGMTLSRLARDTTHRADLRHLDATQLNFDGASLKGVDLAFSKIEQSSFKRAILENSKAIDTRLNNVDLREVRLGKAEWYGVDLIDVRAPNANARGAQFKRCTLRDVNLHRADLRGATFEQSTFSDVDFSNARVSGASFRRTTLDNDTIRSLARAQDWQEATWDPPVRRALQAEEDQEQGAEPSR